MIRAHQQHRDNASRVDFITARERALALARPLAAERVALRDATARVLAETILAADDLVHFARSAMDGYAVCAADTAGASATQPIRLPLAGDPAYAGNAPRSLPAGAAMQIATGGALPAGADAVVPFEELEVLPAEIRLLAPVAQREHVFEAGDDAKRGDILARAGESVSPGRAGLLASGGHAHVWVRRRPRVAILSTGDELIDIGTQTRPGQIRNSNAVMLAAALEHDGARIVLQTHVPDTSRALLAALAEAQAHADLVVTTGGASAGDRDLVKAALRAMSATFAFESVAMRPSKPTAFAALNKAIVAVLPGNPAAAYVAYVAFVRGVVRRLAGRSDVRPATVAATLEAAGIHRKDARHFLMFGVLRFADGRFGVRPLENQCSALTRTAAEANALIIIEPGQGWIEPGQEVNVEVTDWEAIAFGAALRC